MTDRMFARLKPSELDELTEDGYRRRRSADLSRAFATPRDAGGSFGTPGAVRSRRPYVLMAGTLAAGLAAVAAAVVIPGDPAPRPAPTPPPAATTSHSAEPVMDARSFLLAAASTARREPAASGRYWYLNERTLQKVRVVPGAYVASIKALAAELSKKEKKLRADPDGLAAARKEFEREITKLKTSELPYAAYAADTRETWRALRDGDASRTVSGQDEEVTFGSAQDEAAWRAAGAPELSDGRSGKVDDSSPRILSIDNPSLTLQNVSDLPTGKKELKRRLDELWKRSPNTAGAGKSGYLWQTGVDLMTAPIRPGTRSALFQVLADQPGVMAQDKVTDALGRTGVALSVSEPDASTLRLIIDPETAELLQYDMVDEGVPLLQVALAGMGFTDRLGARPQG